MTKEPFKVEEIGRFKGKFISKMSRDELLDFAAYASTRIQSLEILEHKYADLEIKEELAKTFGPETWWEKIIRIIKKKR